MTERFKIANWNIGGAKYLQEEESKRNKIKKDLNFEVNDLIRKQGKPDVITLQEVVRYGKSKDDYEELIDKIKGYRYYSFPLIDTDRLSSEAKWNNIKVIENNKKIIQNWPEDTYFAQGNAFLFKEELTHVPVWDLRKSSSNKPKEDRHFIEQVNLESGLYFGERGSEPRAALVAHFLKNPTNHDDKPLDIFVINTHLTTLRMEREGIPEIDLAARKIRSWQIDVIFNGIISRYNKWRREEYRDRGTKRVLKNWETNKRFEPVWIIAGDFNFIYESVEYERIIKMNFIDLVPNKDIKTKSKGVNNPPTLTLDYIFGGPKFIALDKFVYGKKENDFKQNIVDKNVQGSDHYPLIATIPIEIPED